MNQQWQAPLESGPHDSNASGNDGRKQSGIWHAWLILTGPGDDAPQRTIEERGHFRRARLSSGVMFGMLILALLILPLGLQAPTHATLIADVILFAAVILAAVLNRARLATGAGLVLVAVLILAVMGSILGAQQLDTIYLPAFDLLTIAVIVAAAILPRQWIWIASLVCAALIVVDVLIQPRTKELSLFIAQNGVFAVVARPVAAVLIAAICLFAIIAFLENETARADRTEELEAAERREVEQRRQLDIGINEILQTHVRAANGDFSARAQVQQGNILWQIASSLNNMLTRMQKSATAEHQLQRTEEELQRLAAAIDDAQAGRRPIWPARANTAADLIIERITTRNRPGGPGNPGGPGAMPPMSPIPPMPAPPMGRSVPPMPPMRPGAPQSPFPPATSSLAEQGRGPLSFRGPAPAGPRQSDNLGQMPSTSPMPPLEGTTPLPPDWIPSEPPMPPGQRPARAEAAADGQQNAPDNPWFLPSEDRGW